MNLEDLRKLKIKLKQEVDDIKEVNKLKDEIKSLKKDKFVQKNSFLEKLSKAGKSINSFLAKQQRMWDK